MCPFNGFIKDMLTEINYFLVSSYFSFVHQLKNNENLKIFQQCLKNCVLFNKLLAVFTRFMASLVVLTRQKSFDEFMRSAVLIRSFRCEVNKF